MINVVSGPPREDSIPTSTANLGVSYSEMAIIAEVYALRQFAAISVFQSKTRQWQTGGTAPAKSSRNRGRLEKQAGLSKPAFFFSTMNLTMWAGKRCQQIGLAFLHFSRNRPHP